LTPEKLQFVYNGNVSKLYGKKAAGDGNYL
jgi:hypothetical protein